MFALYLSKVQGFFCEKTQAKIQVNTATKTALPSEEEAARRCCC